MSARNTDPPLTRVARERVGAILHPGSLVIDATIGNGHDTLFLATSVTPGGAVIGFDIQETAVRTAHAKLSAAGLDGAATLLNSGHEHLDDQLPPAWRGQLAAVMFNLGYLPGGDPRIVTRPATTLRALQAAADNLRVGGLVSVLCYRGHPGGADEFDTVREWMTTLPGAGFATDTITSPGPVLCLATRQR